MIAEKSELIFNEKNKNPSFYVNDYKYNIHIGMAGTPKDSSSLGLPILMSLISVAMKKSLNPNIAIAGETNAHGQIIKICKSMLRYHFIITLDGVRERLGAAKNHNIEKIIVPHANKDEINKLPIEFIEGLQIYLVKTIEDVIKISFFEEKEFEHIDFIYHPTSEQNLLTQNEIILEDNAYKSLF